MKPILWRTIAVFFAMSLIAGVLRADEPKEVLEFQIRGFANQFGDLYYSVAEQGKTSRAIIDVIRPLTAAEVKAYAALDCSLELGFLMGSEIVPEAWKELPSLKRVERVEFLGVPISDLGYKTLAKMPNLRTLNLIWAKLQSDDLEGLRTLTQLCELNISGSIPKDGWPALMKLNLTDLEIDGFDQDLKGLSAQKNLKSLFLGGETNLTKRGFEEIAKLDQLTKLAVGGDEAALKSIARLRNLKSLTFGVTNLTDASAADIGQLQELTELNLRECKLSNGVVAMIASLPKLERLDLSFTNLEDRGLNFLQSSARLRHLSITRTAVTVEALGRFRMALPAVEIIRFK